jgi:hypothetical protein
LTAIIDEIKKNPNDLYMINVIIHMEDSPIMEETTKKTVGEDEILNE